VLIPGKRRDSSKEIREMDAKSGNKTAKESQLRGSPNRNYALGQEIMAQNLGSKPYFE
jgi:hypothetical protein